MCYFFEKDTYFIAYKSVTSKNTKYILLVWASAVVKVAFTP